MWRSCGKHWGELGLTKSPSRTSASRCTRSTSSFSPQAHLLLAQRRKGHRFSQSVQPCTPLYSLPLRQLRGPLRSQLRSQPHSNNTTPGNAFSDLYISWNSTILFGRHIVGDQARGRPSSFSPDGSEKILIEFQAVKLERRAVPELLFFVKTGQRTSWVSLARNGE